MAALKLAAGPGAGELGHPWQSADSKPVTQSESDLASTPAGPSSPRPDSVWEPLTVLQVTRCSLRPAVTESE